MKFNARKTAFFSMFATIRIIWLVVVLSCLSLVFGWSYHATKQLTEQQMPPPGKIVFVEGEWVHIRCVGNEKDTTVMFESGVMGWSGVWAWMLENHPKNIRACAWDRPGLGWSKPSTRPADAESSAKVLHALVKSQKIKRPFILTGHSLGGMYSIVYQRMYPKDVSSLVLVDPAHPQQLSRLPQRAVFKTFNQVGKLEGSLPLLDFGAARGVLQATTSTLRMLPSTSSTEVMNVSSSQLHMRRSVFEYKAFPLSAAQAMKTEKLNIPFFILSSSDRERGDRESNEVWWALHEDMSHLSEKGYWTVIQNTTHNSIIMNENSALLVWDRILAAKNSENNN